MAGAQSITLIKVQNKRGSQQSKTLFGVSSYVMLDGVLLRWVRSACLTSAISSNSSNHTPVLTVRG